MNNKILYKALNIIGIGLIITSGVIAIQIYYNEMNSECHADPLVYAAKLYEEQTGYKFVGTGTFVSEGDPINAPTISFSSEGVTKTYPNSNPTFNLD